MTGWAIKCECDRGFYKIKDDDDEKKNKIKICNNRTKRDHCQQRTRNKANLTGSVMCEELVIFFFVGVNRTHTKKGLKVIFFEYF